MWRWFRSLRTPARIDSTPSGPVVTIQPLVYSEVKAWADLMRTQPAPWEVELLMLADRIFQKVMHE